ncbi:TetR/AcrR family transcriptional regulator [Kribbella sp. NPDC059898]|uniref:TetR/AcrR family transcriptional regulator n=1 Tax=Kribbella sp. NPDC059898 TaxID=3346995 RepID=UPI00365DB37C
MTKARFPLNCRSMKHSPVGNFHQTLCLLLDSLSLDGRTVKWKLGSGIMASRKYDQRLRADAAEQTRRDILDALYQRLRDAPTEPVSVERIAAMAGVSRSTVYLVFGSRAGLFDALGDDLRHRGGFTGPVAPDAGNSDALQALRESIRAAVPIFAEHRDVLRVLYSSATLDRQAVDGVVDRMAEERAAGLAVHVERLADQGFLRPDLSTSDAVNLLWAVTGFEFFDQLYTGRGLSAETVADLVIAAAERLLVRDSASIAPPQDRSPAGSAAGRRRHPR